MLTMETIDNFIYITKTLSINITGYICIARYGSIYRGDKVRIMLSTLISTTIIVGKLAQQFAVVD